MNLGAPINGDNIRLTSELDQLQSIGITNLRIMGSTQGPDDKPGRISPSLEYDKGHYNEDIWEGLDNFLYEMGKRNMKAVIALNNYWRWSGGFPQLGDWYHIDEVLEEVYRNSKTKGHMKNFIKIIVNRKNTAYARYEGKTMYYKDDPTIMSWQLANEPRANDWDDWAQWIQESGELIKSLDPNHLVSIGSEGSITGCQLSGNKLEIVDYVTFHAWAQNWGWYSPNYKHNFTKGIKTAK